MKDLTVKTKRNVKYLEQDGYEMLHSGAMVLMKNKKTGKHAIVDAAGTKWYADLMWQR